MELLQKLWIRVSQNNFFWICSRICNYLWGSFIRGYVNAIMRQKKNVLWRKPLFAEKVLASQLLPASRGHPPPHHPDVKLIKMLQNSQNIPIFSKHSKYLKRSKISQTIPNISTCSICIWNETRHRKIFCVKMVKKFRNLRDISEFQHCKVFFFFVSEILHPRYNF